MTAYTADDEGNHSPGPDSWWQESVFVHWYDAVAKVGGVHRIGHEPNAGAGEAAVQCFVFDTQAHYRRVGRMSAGTRPVGLALRATLADGWADRS